MQTDHTVLIIDDTPIFRELGAKFLGGCGRVLTAESGEKGLEMARVERPDLVLVDLGMPGVDGETVCRTIRRDPQLRHTSVIIMLGSNAPAERARALRAGAADVAHKPLSRTALIDSAARHLQSVVGRGQPRIRIKIPVQLEVQTWQVSAVARNLSRGGMYVETEQSLGPNEEVALNFTLPELELPMQTTAEVRWRNADEDTRECSGIGLRFLEIEGRAARQLDDYVHERTSTHRSTGIGAIP